MYQLRTLGLIILGMLLSSGVNASEELSIRYACVACHELDIPRVGPPFVAVAARYSSGGDEAREVLVNRILEGSTGLWGTMPMPPQPQVNREEAREVVDWIFSLVKVQ